MAPLLATPINWLEIERQYDEMIGYASAMRHGTADPLNRSCAALHDQR